jgi:hypothetical protein
MEIIKWLVTSSANPSKYSLTFKGFALGFIPWILQALSLTCGLHLYCGAIDGTFLTSVIETVANMIYYGLSFVAGVTFLCGITRKLWLDRWSAYPISPTD